MIYYGYEKIYLSSELKLTKSTGKIYDYILKENMVVTNEPGIYIPGRFGVRIEDTVLITKYGCQNLTLSEKNYIVVGN